jgi:hypothetical protein
MIQQLIILLIFSAAVFYLGYTIYKNFSAKEGDCGGTCGCSKADLEKIEKELLKKNKLRI